MRTTLTLDRDVAEGLKKEMRRTGRVRSFSEMGHAVCPSLQAIDNVAPAANHVKV